MANTSGRTQNVKTVRRLNRRLVLILIGVTIILSTGSYFLHAFQLKRSASALLERARLLQAEGDLEQAAAYLERYIGFAPDDLDSREQLGTILEELATEPNHWYRIFRIYEEVLRRDPQRSDLRRRQIRIALDQLGQTRESEFYTDARFHINYLLQSNPNDGELQFLLGRCQQFDFQYQQAVDCYQRAIDYGWEDVEVYERLARLLREEVDPPQSERADQLMQSLIESQPESYAAHLAHARYWAVHGSLERALQSAQQAERYAPRDAEVSLVLAELMKLQAEREGTSTRVQILQQIREKLEYALEYNPEEPRLYLGLSQVLSSASDQEKAIAVLRRGLDRLPQHGGIAFALADRLIARGDFEQLQGSTGLMARMRDLNLPEAYLSYLEGRMLVEREGNLPEARDKFLRAQTLAMPLQSSVMGRQLDRLISLELADCYGKMGYREQQLTEYQQILEREQLRSGRFISVEAQLGLIAALQATGRIGEAQAVLGRVQGIVFSPWQTASMLFQQTLQQSPERRDWQQVETALPTPDPADSDLERIRLLRANVFLAQRKWDDARRELEQLCQERPQSVQAWSGLAELELRDQNWERAAELLGSIVKRFGDQADVRQVRIRYWTMRGTESNEYRTQATRNLAQLAEGLEQFSMDDQLRLLKELATAYDRLGEVRKSLEIYEQVADRQPYSMPTQFQLLELARQQGEWSIMQRTVERLRRIEGASGPTVRMAQMMLLIEQAARATSRERVEPLLEEARSLLSRLAIERANWHLVPLNQARINELQNDPDQAIENYAQAIQLGDRNPATLRRAMELLLSRQRYADVQSLMRRIRQDAPTLLTKQVWQAGAQISLSMLDFNQAIAMAREAVAADPSDTTGQIWFSRMLEAAGHDREAEKALRTAAELAAHEPAVWVALVGFLARADRKTEAERAIDQAKAKLPPDAAPLTLGRCYELVERPDLAETHYRAAADARSQEASVISTVADFFLRTDQPDKAEPYLERLQRSDEAFAPKELGEVRRNLARAMAGRNYRQFLQALALLDAPMADSEQAFLNQRLKVRLLGTRPLPSHLRQAVSILEGLEQQHALALEDHFYLASLYDRLEQPEKAADRWRQVMTAAGNHPQYLIAYIQRSLEHGEIAEAEQHLPALQQRQPHNFTTWELQARLQVARNQFDAAIEQLRQYVENQQAATAQRGDRIVQIVNVLEEWFVGQDSPDSLREIAGDEAERWYRVLAEQRPDTVLAFARFLGRRGRIEQGLDICESLLETDRKFDAIGMGLVITRDRRAEGQHARRVETWLEAALSQDSDALAGLIHLAEFRDFQGQHAEAATLYRTILEQAPNHFGVLNNLAWLLSTWRGQHSDAMRLIDRAIELAGPVAPLLDTRATILLNQGHVDQAIEAYRSALAQDDAAATHFRLAEAFLRKNDYEVARVELRKAQQAGLHEDQLHPLEQTAYQRLCRDLEGDSVEN